MVNMFVQDRKIAITPEVQKRLVFKIAKEKGRVAEVFEKSIGWSKIGSSPSDVASNKEKVERIFALRDAKKQAIEMLVELAKGNPSAFEAKIIENKQINVAMPEVA